LKRSVSVYRTDGVVNEASYDDNSRSDDARACPLPTDAPQEARWLQPLWASQALALSKAAGENLQRSGVQLDCLPKEARFTDQHARRRSALEPLHEEATLTSGRSLISAPES
jgi:hypothetical protein